MIKILFLAAILFCSSAISCEVKNNEFNFYYSYTGSSLEYKISRKDGLPFRHYIEPYYGVQPSEIGISFDKKLSSNYKTLNEFYSNDNFYSSYLYRNLVSQRGTANQTTLDLNRFKTSQDYNGIIKIDEYVNSIKDKLPRKYGYGQQEFSFNFNIFLDENMNECLQFQTNPIKYDLGTQYLKDIGIWGGNLNKEISKTFKIIME